ncbi:MAG: aminotransferase class I/II-fold pyridoxal phosphate-dependent enzyme [Candidatus Aminicenantes bacterium]|nr:aminotransferase class I/II-fold pyridoxal phosphate-dependent enzyme [Candidatus Aminicenantes bacterium]
MIRLHMNENPYPPSENVLRAIKDSINNINRYSELKYADKLKEALASYNNASEKRIILSPGSEFLLRELINIFSGNRKLIMTNPTFFPALKHAIRNARKIIKHQLSPPNFELNREMILEELYEPTLIIVDNPNNPTGKMLLDRKFVMEILKNKDILLLVDEAYYEFVKYTFADLVDSYPNLGIVRTMDKSFSLAGLRIGYLIAGDFFLKEIYDFPRFLPIPTLFAAREALKNPEYMEENIRKILIERKRLESGLKKIGVTVFSGEVNFLLIKCDIPELSTILMDRGIMIKDLSTDWIEGFYRVSVGLPEENDKFLAEMEKITNNPALKW